LLEVEELKPDGLIGTEEVAACDPKQESVTDLTSGAANGNPDGSLG
jgi:hypothetical protein